MFAFILYSHKFKTLDNFIDLKNNEVYIMALVHTVRKQISVS